MMNTALNPTFDSFVRKNRNVVLSETTVKRCILGEETKTLYVGSSSSLSNTSRYVSATNEKKKKKKIEPYIRSKSAILREALPLGDRNILNFKAAAFSSKTKTRIGSTVEIKVGLFGSQSRLGQTLQAAGTVVLPGDTSEIRSPIRSRIYAALTPGGGRGARRPGATRGFRCPAGFEFGGRFTDSRYSTCGAQLFGLPTLGSTIGARRGRTPSVAQAAVENISEVVQGGTPQERAIQIQRMAQIPRSGAENTKRRLDATVQAMSIVKGSPAGEGRLIRKDGITLRPLVPSSVLRNFGGNPDMENANFVRSIAQPSDIVGDDLALLSGPAVRQIIYVAPNGTILSIERQRDLTVGERRKFGRQLNRVAGTSDKYDVGNNIREFAANSGGAFKYTEKFPDIDNPLDIIEIEDDKGKKIEVRRWVYETFLKEGAKPSKEKIRREVRTLRVDGAPANDTPQDADSAAKLVDEGGSIFDLNGEMIISTISRSKKYQSRKLGSGVIEYSDGSGVNILQIPETRKNGAVAEKIYNDVSSQLGLESAPLRVAGTPSDRYVVTNDAGFKGGKIDYDTPLSKVNKEDLLSVIVADWVADVQGRSPATLTPVKNGNKTTIIPSGNEIAAGAGLNEAELKKRRALDLPDYLNSRQTNVYKSAFDNLTSAQKEALSKHYDSLIERALKFNWDEFSTRLAVDGNLSDAEKAHITIVQSIYETRVERLRKAKRQFLQLLGM